MKKFWGVSLKVILFFLGWAVCGAFGEIPSDDPAIWRFGAELFPLLWCVVFTILFWLIDKRRTEIPLVKNIGKSILIGAGTGLLWIGICAGILLSVGAESITGKNQFEFLWLWIISAFLNTMMQELLVRGYIYQKIKKEYQVIPAAIVTTALFTLFHGGAFEAGIIPVLNVITMSLFVTALYEYSENLLAPIMAHALWNIIGGIILGGVSLADDYPNVWNMIASGNPLLSGGEYRIEGSVIVLIVNSILFSLFITLLKKKQKSR